jgi:hypothetical protein
LSLEQSSDQRSAINRFPQWQELAIAVGVGLLSLGISVWQMTVPEFLQFYDSGVYLSASIHLVSGILPYRDFTFVQPPGILLLLSPEAVVSRIFGSHDGFILARVMSGLVTALNASLLAWLLRGRGRMIMVVSGASLALLPVACFVSTTVELDPYCICFVLLGSLMVTSAAQRRHEIPTRTLAIAGGLFGIAALIKLWAVFPFIALVLCIVPSCRTRILALVGPAAGIFTALALPFFVAAPRSFISQVLTEQLFRKANERDDVGMLFRLKGMTGFANTSIAPTLTETTVVFGVLACLVTVAYMHRGKREMVDSYLLVAAVVTIGGFLTSPVYFIYYGYFTAPFLIGMVAISMARLGGPARILVRRVGISPGVHRLVTGLLSVIGVLLVFAWVLYVTTFYSITTFASGAYAPWFTPISKIVPSGSCVVYDWAAYGIVSNRLISDTPKCPNIVDSYGMWMAWGYQLIPPSPKFVKEWRSFFAEAQYAVLSSPSSSLVPWNPSLTDWFHANYHLLFNHGYLFIYEHDPKV